MKCQSWVDPAKFNKKGFSTPRAVIGTFSMDWDLVLSQAKGTRREKLEQQRARAVRCGGRVTISLYAECDDEYGSGGVETDLRCGQCQEYVHAVGLNPEVAEQWIQERLDAMD